MSQIFKAFLAALAISATFGAVQFASGHDLASLRQLASTAPAADINRTGKADRAALRAAPGQTETITIKGVGLDDTSVVVRVPVVKDEARNRPAPPVPSPAKPTQSKTAIACEPPVSVLTEVAKLLQPGRCVT
ncbi:hypothetical protein [Bradyrhizobium valentinum]|uniref:Uncharacterized protein n=1 Tax=Bradyrhizobium valentinum TaxID=1518501 RepID=A0A0R3KDB1_9BRAD|nr:hypothetical protein [Bradyrhizobium valentinum]KRQ93507.1 hypothetical protein CQ10_07980 [Bradyrhizobium valentinum]KRQ96720.1 hypothetical protein CP49_27670 [Bradyrhizobium valentinum]